MPRDAALPEFNANGLKLNENPEASDAKPTWINWIFGRYSFAAADARQWAAWGVDYRKYDWFPNNVPHVTEMTDALRATGRDIVYSLFNTGIYDHAADYRRLANVWRTTGDINDSWESVNRIGFLQDRWAGFTGPGHGSDPDTLVVGMGTTFRVRDLWRQRDLGDFKDSFATKVAAHGVVLIRLIETK